MIDADWLRRLHQRATTPPRHPRVPLHAAGVVGPVGSIEPALAARVAAAGLPLRTRDGGWWIDDGIDASLAAIAHWLDRQGIGGRWRDELLAVTDADGRPVAAVERAAVRPLGITTHAVHLVGHAADGRTWVQQRALDKSTDPGMWDTLVGGLVAARESVAGTLERETWEEAGLRIDALRNVTSRGRVGVRRPVSNGYMVEQIDIFSAIVPDGLVPANQDGEVECFECLDRAALLARLRQDRFTLEAAVVLVSALGLHE